MSLRQRPVSADNPLRDLKQDIHPPKLHPPPPTKLSRFPILIGALLLATILYATRSSSFRYDAPYALCSGDPLAIYTVDQHDSNVDCILVHKTKILATGSLEYVQTRWREDGGQPTALKVRRTPAGSIVVPGLSDAHVHLLEYGASKQLPLEGTSSIKETVRRVRDFVLANPDVKNNASQFVWGGGWDHTVWGSVGWPTAADLEADPVLKGRPIVLQSKDCHALWVSNAVIEASLPLPEAIDGGVVVRDDSGRPTGMFLDNAQDIVAQPELSEDELLRRFSVAVRDAVAFGLTSVHDAGLNPASLDFFARQAKLNNLPIRIYGMSYFDENGEYWGNTTEKIVNAGNGKLNARSVKIFADGALRTSGAALYEPYADDPTTKGFMRISPEVLYHFIPLFLKDGWQVNVHAIGDRANGMVLDVFETVLQGVDISASRPRLEHAQIITASDRKRLGKLGVIASVQPTHAISDMWYAQDRLGPERVKNLYAFRSIVAAGARIALGSDFPVESPNPLSGFYAAITRLSYEGTSPHGPDGWFPEERLTRNEALRGMTIDPAYASFSETTLGSLEAGKRADFVVLSQNIMTIAADQIMSTKVLATVIDGEPVYGQF
ncbi:putative amidohydrolase YtcJ [Mycena kentingensis (nom. inval.)]|nr:putative amidohydrolase YtcJ [Mycena kentingensis (nom. inval.)]